MGKTRSRCRDAGSRRCACCRHRRARSRPSPSCHGLPTTDDDALYASEIGPQLNRLIVGRAEKPPRPWPSARGPISRARLPPRSKRRNDGAKEVEPVRAGEQRFVSLRLGHLACSSRYSPRPHREDSRRRGQIPQRTVATFPDGTRSSRRDRGARRCHGRRARRRRRGVGGAATAHQVAAAIRRRAMAPEPVPMSSTVRGRSSSQLASTTGLSLRAP